METKLWHFESNQFDTSTKDNYKLAESITKQHANALNNESSVTFIGVMYTAFILLRNTFETAYVYWLSLKASKKAATLKVKNLFKLLSSKMIESWDIKIQNVYAQDSEEYMALLPNRRSHFQRGTYEEKIIALKSLSKNLENDTALSAVLADIDLFITQISDARNNKQKLDEAVSLQSQIVDEARLECAITMYANLGGLMQHFCRTPEAISRFFDLKAIRSHPRKTNDNSEEYTIAIAPNTTKEAGIMFTENTKFLLFNNSEVPLYAYTGLENDTPNPALMLSIAPDEEKEVSTSELGMPGSRFLFIVNKDLHEAGEMDISLLEGEE